MFSYAIELRILLKTIFDQSFGLLNSEIHIAHLCIVEEAAS